MPPRFFPAAAQANRPIFYDTADIPRIAGVCAELNAALQMPRAPETGPLAATVPPVPPHRCRPFASNGGRFPLVPPIAAPVPGRYRLDEPVPPSALMPIVMGYATDTFHAGSRSDAPAALPNAQPMAAACFIRCFRPASGAKRCRPRSASSGLALSYKVARPAFAAHGRVARQERRARLHAWSVPRFRRE